VRVEFTSFYEREAPRLMRSVALATGDPAEAEDAVAEAFARAWSRWSQVRACDQPAAWVMRVALNHVKDRFRRRGVERRRGFRFSRPEAVDDPPPEVDPRLWDAVRALPKQERTLVALRYVSDLSQPEIAEVLRIPVGTVASGLTRARRRLGAALGPAYQEEPT